MEALPLPAEPSAPGSPIASLLDAHPQRDGVVALLRRLQRHHAQSAAHSTRVGQVMAAMAREAPAMLGDAATALVAGLLHDVGKLHVPAATLDSPAGLDHAARALIRAHPEEGAVILAEAGFGAIFIDVARGHHERWGGGGYPGGRPATAQPPLARAVAVADALVAMVEPGRTYRAPLAREAALAELRACAGIHFDPEATAILLAAVTRRSPPLETLLGP